MKKVITSEKKDGTKTFVFLTDTTFHVWTKDVEFRKQVHYFIERMWRHGIVVFDEPKKSTPGKIEIIQKVVRPGDPIFIHELIKKLRKFFSGTKINVRDKGIQKKELQNAIRRKIVEMKADDSLKPFINKIYDTIDRLDIFQLQKVLEELEKK